MLPVQYLFARVNGTWRRAEIKKVMDRSVIIFCVDYGHTTTVKCHDLRPAIGLSFKLRLFLIDSILNRLNKSERDADKTVSEGSDKC